MAFKTATMTTINDATTALQRSLVKNHYPASYFSELRHFLDLSDTLSTALSSKQLSLLQHVLFLLDQDVPVEYIVGKALFLERYFYVNRDVLIPRFDSEALVQWVVSLPIFESPCTIIDIGTGSGALILSCVLELKSIERAAFFATDISPATIAVAQKNAAQLKIRNVTFSTSMFPLNAYLTAHYPETENVVIVTNPPYISEEHMKTLPKSVTYEPALALKEQPNFLAKLQDYIDELERRNRRVHVAIEYNDKAGKMIQRYSTNQKVDLQALLSS